MRSTFHSLEVAKRGIYGHQTALTTTGHNISNANTLGYSRQRVNFTADRPIEVIGFQRSGLPGQLGTGLTVDSIKRIRDSFLDGQFRKEYQSYGSWTAQRDTLAKIEILFNETGELDSTENLSAVIDKFWNSWQELSKKQDDLPARHVLKENTLAMLDSFKYIDKKLTDLGQDLTNSIAIKVEEANTYINQIAELNQEIRRVEVLGDNANDLRDKRDLLADQLSGLVEIQVSEQADGSYTITLPASGTQLVNGAVATPLGEGGAGLNLVTGGEIQGMIHSRDVIVEEYQAHLNTMLKTLIYGDVEVTIPEGSILPIDLVAEDGTIILAAGNPVPAGGITHTVQGINGLHSLGWTMGKDENGNPIGGVPFFVPLNEEEFSIQSVQLNPDIVKDVNLIAGSMGLDEDGSVLRGNNTLALLMAQLKNSSFNFQPPTGAHGEGTFEDYLRSVVSGIGVKSKYAQDQISKQEIILTTVDNNRQGVSGVSLDEEFSNMIKFQHAYNASARMMTTVDEMLDRIINGMGIVGR